MQVIFSHDWLNGMRGGERVLELLCRGIPNSQIYTLLHVPGAVSDIINSHPIHTSSLQRYPKFEKYYRYYLPLFPRAIEAFELDEADMVISTSHCVAKGIHPDTGTPHLCYCFTPMRYAWTFYREYFGKNPLKRAVLNPMLHQLRKWDYMASKRVDCFVAISHHVRRRIWNYYGRNSEVVYPPVNTDYYTPSAKDEPGSYDLVVSALVPYKRVDLAIAAYNKSGFPLKIVGVGSEMKKLKKKANSTIEFTGWKTDAEIREYYRHCRYLIFPGEEDFGIVPVEAQACGKPVIAFHRGGALETVKENESGVFFDRQTADDLVDAVDYAGQIDWDRERIRKHAERFRIQRFIDEMDYSISQCMKRKVGLRPQPEESLQQSAHAGEDSCDTEVDKDSNVA